MGTPLESRGRAGANRAVFGCVLSADVDKDHNFGMGVDLSGRQGANPWEARFEVFRVLRPNSTLTLA